MTQKALSKWLKMAIIAVGVFGLFLYVFLIPYYGYFLAYVEYPEFSYFYVPWLVFLSVSGLPCYAVLVLGWLISSNIGRDRSFSEANSKYLKWIAILAGADSIYFFIGDVGLWFAGMNHPGVALFLLSVELIGIPVTIAAAVLSHLVHRAAVLQEQNDLTI